MDVSQHEDWEESEEEDSLCGSPTPGYGKDRTILMEHVVSNSDGWTVDSLTWIMLNYFLACHLAEHGRTVSEKVLIESANQDFSDDNIVDVLDEKDDWCLANASRRWKFWIIKWCRHVTYSY